MSGWGVPKRTQGRLQKWLARHIDRWLRLYIGKGKRWKGKKGRKS